MELQNISYLHSKADIPLQEKFILHNHPNHYEVIFLIQGDVSFFAEGNSYIVHPYDICLARNNELHQIVHNSLNTYERIVVKINVEFFHDNHCTELQKLFTDRKLGQNNLIPHSATSIFHLPALFQKIDSYFENGSNIAALCVLTEILSILNNLSYEKESSHKSTGTVNEIINYIHTHRTEKITLESISKHFYINKQYLCKVFKSATGFTVNQYINLQRYMYVEELLRKGIPKTKAALDAGFGTYTAYHKFQKKYASLYFDL